MIIEATSRTKKCTDCGAVGHNTVMLNHKCVGMAAKTEKAETKTKTVRKYKKSAKR